MFFYGAYSPRHIHAHDFDRPLSRYDARFAARRTKPGERFQIGVSYSSATEAAAMHAGAAYFCGNTTDQPNSSTMKNAFDSCGALHFFVFLTGG